MTRLHKSLLAGASTLVLALVLEPAPALAVCPGTIVNGETQVVTQNLANGQDCVIEAGGAINTANIFGISAPSNNNTITNSGSISTAGDGAEGIFTRDNNTVTNSGSISTTGDNANGIVADDNNTITSSGSISTIGINAAGIFARFNNIINNSGSISTAGPGAEGIEARDNNTITNSGSISTTGNSSEAIDTFNNNMIANSGSISTSGNDSIGIDALDNNTITNSGWITTTGATAEGIRADDNNTITNFGLISATGAGSNAIRFTGNMNALLLNPGSVIIGPLSFQQVTNTLTIGNGLSIANTFTGNLPGTINANGAPFAVNGLQVAVVDPTNLAAQDELLADLTSGIFGTVQNRLGGLRNGVAGVTTNPRPMSVGASGTSKYSEQVQDTRRQGWAQGFGSYRRQSDDSPTVESDIRLGGLVSGFDGMTGNGTRLGVFFGGSQAEVEADFNSQDTDVDSLFGGFYASTLRGNTAIDFALTVGYSDYDRTRRVANNTVATGIESARTGYDGWFISPELTLTRPMWAGEQRFEKSLTLRYSGLFLDGFTETGTAAPLTVNDRDVHVLQARTQLTMPVEHHGADGSSRRSALYIGLEGRAQVGEEDVTGTLLAQNITFDPGGDDAVAGLFAGLEFERTSAGGTIFFASVEGQYETGGGRQASGKAGIRFRF